MTTVKVNCLLMKKKSINKSQNFACISVGADQPRKQLCEELTNHDYCEGKLLTHEKKY